MDWLEKKIQGIVSDRQHGAAQLASAAVKILMTACKRSKSADLAELKLEVKQVALSLSQARPSMAPIGNWSLIFAHRFQLQAEAGISIRAAKRTGVLLGEELLEQQRGFIRRQIEAARALLKKCRSVATLSYSSTVESILRHALPSGCRVVIAESRPLLEGRRLFNNLADGFFELQMITDAQMGLDIPEVDLVLVGADSVLGDLAVINKTGTYLAALVAQAHSRDFFVAADTYKINASMNSRDNVLESKSGKEVWPRQQEHCANVYFDITPGELISGFISEEGILEEAEMRKHVRHWQRLVKDLAISA
jgi:translation initiation factor 2B subunit (eIF-2B alpha/beta/delta family)